MKLTFYVAKEDLRRILLTAAASAVFTIGLAFGVAAVVSNDVEDTTLQTVQTVQVQGEETRDLLCDILAKSKTPAIRRAVANHCGP